MHVQYWRMTKILAICPDTTYFLSLLLIHVNTENSGYSNIGYDDISLILVLPSCPELFPYTLLCNNYVCFGWDTWLIRPSFLAQRKAVVSKVCCFSSISNNIIIFPLFLLTWP